MVESYVHCSLALQLVRWGESVRRRNPALDLQLDRKARTHFASVAAEVIRLSRLKKQHLDSQYQLRYRMKSFAESG